ncbi:hypothetical protein Tco_1512776 [Tanacetum coccineum]
MLVLQAEEGEGSGNPSESQPPPSTTQPTHEDQSLILNYRHHKRLNHLDKVVYQERGDSVERVATTATSLECRIVAPRDHGGASVQTRFEKASKLSYDSPLGGGNTPQSDEDSMTLQELTALCIKLSDRVLALETNLRKKKKDYGIAYTKLIMKVKKLEKTVKTSQARRRAKIMVLDDDMALEDSSKQGRMIEEIDQDVGVTLVTPTKVNAAKVHTYSRRRRAVSISSGGVSTASRIVSTAGLIQQVNIIIPSSSETKDKEERQKIARDAEVAQRLQEEIDAQKNREWLKYIKQLRVLQRMNRRTLEQELKLMKS